MKDREISAGCAIAYSTWVLGVVLLVAMWVTEDRRIGVTGLAVVGIAMTATIRTYFVELGRATRNAFELGRDSVTPLPRR